MSNTTRAIVVIGDLVASRRDFGGSADWLRDFVVELDAAYVDDRLAPFGFTQGDELQGLLRTAADPFAAVVRAGTRLPHRRMRWAIAIGDVEPGRGPATERSGRAFLAAREAIERAGRSRDGLVSVTGDPTADALLGDVSPVLAALLDDLTDRQREIGRLLLVDGLRQSEVAERLGISRASVSVSVGRGRMRSIERLARASRAILSTAVDVGAAR